MEQLQWHNERRRINELIPYAENPRLITEKEQEDLKKSLERFNLVEIPAIDTDNKIIAGHQRLKVLQILGRGEEEIDVRVPSRKLTQEEFMEYNLRSNKNLGEWDYNLLANFDENLLLDIGFSNDEIDTVFGLDKADDFDEKKEFEKAVKEPRGIQFGDVWKLGDHKLIVADSTDKDAWAKLMGDERFDFMFTDPPYRLAYNKKRVRKVHTKEGWKVKGQREYDTVGETDKKGKPKGFGSEQNRTYEGITDRGVPEFDEWLSIAHEYENQKGVNIMVFENWKNVHDLWEAIQKYWKIRNMVIWHLPSRHQGFSAKYSFYSRYDIAPIADAGKSTMNEDPEQEIVDYLEEKGQKLLDSYEISLYGNKGQSEWERHSGKWGKVSDHVSWIPSSESSTGQNLVFGTKPIQILVPYIKVLSPRNGIVMEPFGGSGSTAIACEIMKRKCRLIEISPTYSEVIVNRWEKFTGKTAQKI